MTRQTLPLQGKTVLVPRGKEQAKSFSDLVNSYGGIPVEIPLIAFKPLKETKEIVERLNQLHLYDWIIFTSDITVETFLEFSDHIRKSKLPRIAAIGRKTAGCLTQAGFNVDFIPNEYVAEGFVKEFLSLIEPGIKILIPKGNLARDYICTTLTEKGAFVDEIIIYETFFPEESREQLIERISANNLDILPFTSPSTVDHFMKVIRENNLVQKLDECIISCIGPVTKARIESYGFKIHCEPRIYTVDHMIKSIIEYLIVEDK
ncbi:uroporphyrinogen-III synthase [Cytobacillus dafuensis]|uniref:Uroporphyrinogen-III synthase n=1 Tax=Cytobacillus dafuensis TaxID=1742359 RepID=A0A5B8Z6T9_CYTDA|nr:uroporphyrinogen-III synthase [Cytobacillus dafuensis]QED48815.1 uroporphyrinogen-III synthase [Cytobacillus dafuensis]